MKISKAITLSLMMVVAAQAGETIHMGLDQPIREISKLKHILADRTDISEVVIHEGVYFGGFSLQRQKDVDHATSPLLIRAAEGAKVVFVGSLPLGEMTPVEGMAGVWSAPAGNQSLALASVWDQAARIRYERVADLAAVAHFPGSFTIERGVFYVHTSDGGDPAHLRKAVLDHGIFCNRPNVTIRGIHFRDYRLRDKWSNGIDLRTDDITVENCTSENTSLGFIVNGANCVVRNCTTIDTGGGVYVQGQDTLVENCRLFKRRDDFMVPMYNQDDTGIQFYYPAKGGVIRGNLCVGFDKGVFIKAHRAPYVIEHNTIDGAGQGKGFGATKWHEEERFRFNIVANCLRGLEVPAEAEASALANNLYNLAVPTDPTLRGDGLIVGEDPGFIAPALGDYRLANDSPALRLMNENRPAGAYAAIGDEPAFADSEPRELHVAMNGRNGFDGTPDKPWRTIQHAVDMSRPGDSIIVHPGIYEEPVVMTRGGIEGKPLVIRAAEKWKAILDSNRKVPVAIRIANASHIELHDLEIRWYGKVAVAIDESPHVTLAGCRIWNAHWGGTWPTGSATRVTLSPYFTAHHNVLFAQEQGLWLNGSPHARLTNNTMVENLYGGMQLLHSSVGSVVQNNIFAWNVNDALVVYERKGQLEALKEMVCNHNVYVTQLRLEQEGVACDSLDPPTTALRGQSKAIFNYSEQKGDLTRLYSMSAWRDLTGLDADSVFVDPKFVSIDDRDFRLQPDSPLIGSGAGGMTIGACEAAATE